MGPSTKPPPTNQPYRDIERPNDRRESRRHHRCANSDGCDEDQHSEIAEDSLSRRLRSLRQAFLASNLYVAPADSGDDHQKATQDRQPKGYLAERARGQGSQSEAGNKCNGNQDQDEHVPSISQNAGITLHQGRANASSAPFAKRIRSWGGKLRALDDHKRNGPLTVPAHLGPNRSTKLRRLEEARRVLPQMRSAMRRGGGSAGWSWTQACVDPVWVAVPP